MTQRPTMLRHVVIGLTALTAVLLYLDRFCISFAGTYIKEDLDLSNQQLGWLFSAFFLPYALAQVPSGWLTDRYGARIMLTIYVLAWSLFTALTGLVTGFVMLVVLRCAIGLGQAGAYPTAASLISKWVPFSQRGSASSVVAVGGRLGGAIAPALTAILIVMLVPVSVPSELASNDLMFPERLAWQIERAWPEAGAGSLAEQTINTQLTAPLTPAERSRLQASAAQYQQALARKLAGDKEGHAESWLQRSLHWLLAPLQPAPSDKPKPIKYAETVPLHLAAAEQMADQDRTWLAGRLNQLLSSPELLPAEIANALILPDEAKAILQCPVAERTDAQTARLNRLILEHVYRDSIRQIYGLGWRWVLGIYGLAGLGVAGLFWWKFRDRPEIHPDCNAAEVALIEYGRPPTAPRPHGAVQGVPVRAILTSGSMWLMCLCQWSTNIGWVFLVTWLPIYLETVHSVPPVRRGILAGIPLAIGFLGTLSGGWCTDYLVRRIGLRWGRALPMSVAKLLGAGAYFACLLHPSPELAVAAFSLVAFSTDFCNAPVWAYMQDVGGRYVGSIHGWGNMWGNLGATITPPLLIAIVGEQRNWDQAFIVLALAFIVSGVAALAINAEKPIAPPDELPPQEDPPVDSNPAEAAS